MIKSILSKLFGTKEEVKMEDNKIVCGCFKITEQDLKNAIKNGAKSFEEVQAIIKVGTGCGRCVEINRELVNQLLRK